MYFNEVTTDKIINTSSSSTDSSPDSGSEHASDSDTNLEAAFLHKDTWSRKNKNQKNPKTPSTKRKRKSCIGFYQKPSKTLRIDKILLQIKFNKIRKFFIFI